MTVRPIETQGLRELTLKHDSPRQKMMIAITLKSLNMVLDRKSERQKNDARLEIPENKQ